MTFGAAVAAMLVWMPAPLAAQCIAPPAGLIGWWPGDGNADDVYDGRHGDLMNGTTTGAGLVGQAFSLDGIDDFVNVPHDAALDVGSGDFTVNMWVNFASGDGEQILVEKYVEALGPGVSGWTFARRWNTLHLATPSGSLDTDELTTPINTWMHVAARRNGNAISVLVNGVVTGTGSTSGSLSSSSSLKFGHRGNPSDTPGSNDTREFFLNGKLDEVQLHNRALSDAEIQAIVAAGADGQCQAPPVCGNGLTQPGEACDDGNATPGDGCENDCTLSCGDGIITGSEVCDDNNLIDGDGCDSNCTPTGCGNGATSPGEECDDGNAVEGDGCDSNCTTTACGNGIRSANEACEDGNLDDGDGCESNCSYTQVSEDLPPGGGTVSTDTGTGATPEFPGQIELEINTGGTVTIDTVTGQTQIDGAQIIGVSFQIEAPPTSVADPMIIRFTIDASVIPLGAGTAQLEMVRDHVPLDDCVAPVAAEPDPCLADLTGTGGGDVEFVVRTSHASLWQAALRGQDKLEQKCVNAMNKAGAKVAKAQGKAAGACLKKASLGQEADAQGCLTADVGGKVARKTAKTTETETKSCTVAPPFGFVGAGAVNTAAQNTPVDLVADIFGADLTAAVLAAADPAAGCQAVVLKTAQKLFDTKAKLFLKCKKEVLAGKTSLAVAPGQLSECFATVAADAKGKAAKALEKLELALAGDCAGVDLPTALPGACFAGGSPAACMDRRTACRLCQMFDATDALGADCDLVDDGSSNSSCE